jgi:protein kinase A
MPSLGLFKKKRAKESSEDSPSSPVKDKHTDTTSTFPTSAAAANTTATQPPSSSSPSQAPDSKSVTTEPSPSATTTMTQPTTSSASTPAGSTPGGGTTTTTTTTTTMSRETKGKYGLSDFAIQRTLGTGSFGRVHLVQSKHNQRFYAIKVLKKAQVVKMKQVEHTNDERKMLQRVKHPFLITLWGTFQDARNLYMVMDFIEGGELFSLLRKSQVRMGILRERLFIALG